MVEPRAVVEGMNVAKARRKDDNKLEIFIDVMCI